jgi:hypothetical protein
MNSLKGSLDSSIGYWDTADFTHRGGAWMSTKTKSFRKNSSKRKKKQSNGRRRVMGKVMYSWGVTLANQMDQLPISNVSPSTLTPSDQRERPRPMDSFKKHLKLHKQFLNISNTGSFAHPGTALWSYSPYLKPSISQRVSALARFLKAKLGALFQRMGA